MFVKLHSQLLDSSLWSESPETCKVWVTLLLMANFDGIVHSTAPGIASRCGLSLAVVNCALQSFLQPDADSRNLSHDGRRLEKTDGGFKILNYVFFRFLGSQEWQREQTRLRVQKYRQQCNAAVTPGNATKNEDRRSKNEDKEEDTQRSTKEDEYRGNSKRIRNPNVPVSSSGSSDLHRSSGRSTSIHSVGDVLKRIYRPSNGRTDEVISRIVKVTRDKGFLVDGWRAVVASILAHPGAASQLSQILDDLPKDSDPRLSAARGRKQILNPGSYISSQLKRLEKIATSTH